MYTILKSYQIIIGLLKKYGISHCVLSAGSRNVPFVHSVEEDPYFHCYSVVDERSAAYFALGLSQEINEPVVISCTSSTATCNYWPAVAEAFYQGVPLIVLTSDRDPARLGQWEDQMIDQVGMYDRHVRKSVNLPILEGEDKDGEIFCQRLVNEALLELNHHGTGPVHINIPMKSYNTQFYAKELMPVIKIDRLCLEDDSSQWHNKVNTLKKAKRILVTCGQQSFVTDRLQKGLKAFFERYNAVIAIEHMSNIELEEGINTNVCMDVRFATTQKVEELLPDIVISFGGQVFSGLKEQLKNNCGKFEHWLIQEDGRVVDLYKSITTIFECTPEYFFDLCCQESDTSIYNDRKYYSKFKEYADSVGIPEFTWSHIYAIKNVVERIPEHSILHLSINDSIRIANFFKLKSDIKTYANIGTHGIDGCMSSFFGQAIVSDRQAYLIIGDLAFFYDMNAIRLRHIRNNCHILLINNEGGSEFYYNGIWQNESSDLHTTARHHTKAEGWVKSNNYIYLCAHDKESFQESLKTFMRDDLNSPVLLEVFTEMKSDANAIHNYYDMYRPRDVKAETIKKTKQLIKATLGADKVHVIAEKLKRK